ncbi:aminotransferase class V-fold PLP-dependent enzyme [Microvirga brassicacearum]|uniref:Aminotransferase class V-fold PLP-dependent enzyme n=1 Tax=Microvirga brassicacearum TaxID=2580413 RepID=A0A5N3PIH3_9HYPH|nr:aminotransferase class V-fold PLP-dependent enzyme [Microvirga brassicacearum]KAB0269483.1 aminotransferase class V-fold PLP-dependent enzyme [Microvirga brassicacearum]
MLDLRSHFSRFLNAEPGRLHFAAHSHHPWPDVTRDAHLRAWDDAASLIDGKWEYILGPVLQEFRTHVARQLNLPDPKTIAVAPNTHEFVKRILSCFPAQRSVRVLTTDSEFHSFSRQIARLEEEGLVMVTRVPVEPFASFEDRFLSAAQAGHDLVFASQVFFNSGFAMDIERLTETSADAMIVIDGYHGFMARPTDLNALSDRVFYLAGGYKYAMSGEGACFMHCPPDWGPRPRDTGWYAAFGDLSNTQKDQVGYSGDGWRFMGSTFDPSGLYRFNAVMRWLAEKEIAVEAIHDHARSLQRHFLQLVAGRSGFEPETTKLPPEALRGNFLSFERPDAREIHQLLTEQQVVTDTRGNRLRFGFGIYHTLEEAAELARRLYPSGGRAFLSPRE